MNHRKIIATTIAASTLAITGLTIAAPAANAGKRPPQNPNWPTTVVKHPPVVHNRPGHHAIRWNHPIVARPAR